MLDDELEILHSPEFFHGKAVCGAHLLGQRIERVEAHRLEGAPGARELELQMLLAHHALAQHLEIVAEERLRKSLSPDLVIQEPRQAEIEIRGLERAVRLDRARELRRGEQLARHDFEALGKAREIGLAQSQARGGSVTAEAQEQSRFALGEQVERIAQMQPRDRSPRTPDLSGTPGRNRGREGEGGTVVAVLDASREDPDDALMPARVVEADAAALADRDLRYQVVGLRLHPGLDRAPLAVQIVELCRDSRSEERRGGKGVD